MKRAKANKQSHTNAKSKNSNLNGDWHVNHSSMGMGDYYGTGVRAKLGRMREGMGMVQISSKKMKTPPRSVT